MLILYISSLLVLYILFMHVSLGSFLILFGVAVLLTPVFTFQITNAITKVEIAFQTRKRMVRSYQHNVM